MSRDLVPSPDHANRRVLACFVILFWVAQFGLLSAQRFAFVDGETLIGLVPRLLVTLCAILFSFGIAWVLVRMRGSAPWSRVLVTIALAILATPFHALANHLIFLLFMPAPASPVSEILISYVAAMLQWLWSYAAAAGMIYALLAHFEAQAREREIARLRGVASEAQLRALRYQLNPHFMFNTLNSVTALIAAGRAKDAEAMVENLADFLRAGLSLDPLEDISLKRELEFQALYLAIEQVRFGDRLRVRQAVSAEARQALVPSLVTQPLIENAIRHGVAVTAEPVDLLISAEVEQGELRLTIVNSAPASPSEARRSTSVGLHNVEDRLRARFGEDVRFAAGPADDGTYIVRIACPFVRAGASS